MRDVDKVPKGVSRVERQRLSLQKSAPLIVPKKRLITGKGRGGRLDEADEQSQNCRWKTVARKRDCWLRVGRKPRVDTESV